MDEIKLIESTEKLIYLSKTDPEVAELIKQNSEILELSYFLIREYTTDICVNAPVFPYKITGKLHSNGFLYMDTHNLMALSYPIGNWKKYFGSFYPTKYTGKIDFLGNIDIEATELAYRFLIAKRAKGYKCMTNQNGNLEFEVDMLTTQSNRNEYTIKLVGDPFCKNEFKRKEFMSNRQKLLKYLD